MVKYFIKLLGIGFAMGIICFYIVENIYARCGMVFAAAMTLGVVMGYRLDGMRIWLAVLLGSALMDCGWITAVFAGGALVCLCRYATDDKILCKNSIIVSLGLTAAGIVIACL